jgi:hypothetical protein
MKQIRRIAYARAVVEPLRAPVQIELTAPYQANPGALPEEFTAMVIPAGPAPMMHRSVSMR